jgi:hypothetical protein
VNHYLNKKGKKNAQLPSCAKFIIPLIRLVWRRRRRRWLLEVLRTIFHRVTNSRWFHMRTGFIVPLHWWWPRRRRRRRRIYS